MLVGTDQGVHIGVCTVLGRVTLQECLAQGVYRSGHLDLVALHLHGRERVPQRFEHRQIGGTADIAGIGREVKQDDGDFARMVLAAL